MPSDDLLELSDWKDELSGRADEKIDELSFDLVVVGGGMSGCGTALASRSQGLKVAVVEINKGRFTRAWMVHEKVKVVADFKGRLRTTALLLFGQRRHKGLRVTAPANQTDADSSPRNPKCSNFFGSRY